MYNYRLSDVTRLTGIPQATLYNYLRYFSDLIPFQSSGRQKRFSDESVEKIKEIRELLSSGQSIASVKEHYRKTEVALQHITDDTIATIRSEVSNYLKATGENIAQGLEKINQNQKDILESLPKLRTDLAEKIKQSQEQFTQKASQSDELIAESTLRLDENDKKLREHFRELEDINTEVLKVYKEAVQTLARENAYLSQKVVSLNKEVALKKVEVRPSPKKRWFECLRWW